MKMMTLLFITVVSLATVQPGWSRILGTFGKTYPVIERDALEEIQERAAQINWKSETDKIKPETFHPTGLPALPRATDDRSFLVDMTYTLGFDIPDGHGRILYPQGFKFNPLDYLPFQQTLVVFNGDDPLQIAWLKTSGLLSKPDILLLLSAGSFIDFEKGLGRLVYYLTPQLAKRFHLRATPSVIYREKKLMRVQEVDVTRKED